MLSPSDFERQQKMKTEGVWKTRGCSQARELFPQLGLEHLAIIVLGQGGFEEIGLGAFETGDQGAAMGIEFGGAGLLLP